MPMIKHETTRTAIEGVVEEPGQWTKNGSLAIERHGVRIEVETGTNTALDADWATMGSGLDKDVAQTLVYVLGEIATHVMRGESDVPISINAILEWKGFSRHRKGDFFPEHKRREAARLQHISKWVFSYTTRDKVKAGSRVLKRDVIRRSPLFTFIETQSLDSAGPAARQKRAAASASMGSALVVKSKAELSAAKTPLELPLYAGENEVPYNVTISPGTWIKKLIADGRIRYLPSSLGSLDMKVPSERIAFNVAIALFFSDLQVFTIGEIIELAPGEAVPPRHPERYEEAFYQAFDTLQKMGMFRSWKFTHQPDKPDYRWVPIWLTWRIEIEPFATSAA